MSVPLEPRQLRKFNPGTLQSDEEVFAQFVVRAREFTSVLDVLRANIDASSCQHVLLFAPRGQGKTMILARVAAELRTDEALFRRLIPVRFMEESHEVFNMGDFWLETLFYLAREHSVADPELSRELKDAYDALASEWRGPEVEGRARAMVLQAADRLRVQLVLMVENLQALCGQADEDFGWKLRSVLQSEPKIILLATATSRFKGLDDANEPFFEMFRTFELAPLDTEECRLLWQAASGDTVSRREVRPVQILTGGCPRLVVMVIAALIAQHGGSASQLMEALVRLIDDHTEYFRGHLERFSKTERRVYLAVIDLWQPSKTGEIAARARMDVRSVSALLGRLVQRGAVVVEGDHKKERMYVASERLYSIYYKLRRERDEATAVRNLVHFMAAFYTETDTTSPPKPGARKPPTTGKEVELSIRDSGGNHDKSEMDAQIAKALLHKGMALRRINDLRAEIAAYDGLVRRFGGSDAPEVQTQIAKALFNKGVTLDELEGPHAGIAAYNEVVSRFGDSKVREIQLQVIGSLANKAEGEIGLGHAEEALSVCDELKRKASSLSDDGNPALSRRATWLRTEALFVLNRHAPAMEEFRAAYTLFKPDEGTIVPEMLAVVPNLIVAGARERDMVEVLSSDEKKAGRLLPLVVALRQSNGETVRAPAEVREVATDILETISERR